MPAKPRNFLTRTTEALVVVFIFLMLDIFVPENFYKESIDNMKVFRMMGTTMLFMVIASNIIYLAQTKFEEKQGSDRSEM